MRHLLTAAAWIATMALAGAAAASPCSQGQSMLGVSRVVEIDTASGPLYGDITKFARQDNLLGPREVVLTFDDGPMPGITRSILDTLDRFCTKATFFSVGRMAVAYPATVKEVLARGHTLGTHTWSHPLNMRRMKPESAREEVEKGFAAVALAAGQPIAPFFRFPGLSDNAALLSHLQQRGVATFTVDVVSNDSFIHDAGRLAQATIQKVEQRQGGILLFHDIKAATARALPTILSELKARGYKVVHLRAKAGFEPDPGLTAQLQPVVAKALSGKPQLQPFFAGMVPPKAADGVSDPEVTAVVPEPKSFQVAHASHLGNPTSRDGEAKPRRPRQRGEGAPATTGWATTIRRSQRTSTEQY